jgi:arylsulfatase A-like enzyme
MQLRAGPKNAPRATLAAFLSIAEASNRIIAGESHREATEEKQLRNALPGTGWSGRLLPLLLATVCLAVGGVHAADRPNVVIILADDLGWNDVGFHGSAIRTPNLDRLAAGGAVLNALYVQPFSSQTRAALLTGRYPMRYGLQTLSLSPSSQYGLPVEERTLAQAFKDGGYRTAFVGNWLLGHVRPEYWPGKRGFDTFYGSLSGQVEPMLRKTAKADWRRNDRPIQEEGYVTDLLAREAVAIIARHDPAVALLLVVSFNTPAQFHAVPKSLLDQYRDVPDDTRRSYAAAVTALDAAVGAIVAALEKHNMLDNTLLVFQSDNGGAVPTRFATGDRDVERPAADNGIFREGRGSLYEGGVRAVALASWPGRIKPKTTVTEPLHVTDLYPTLLGLAGASLEQPKKIDGVDVWPVIADEKRTQRKDMLLNVEDFGGAIRVGEWKLIVHASLPSRIELYDIANDPEEADNKAGAYPDRVKELLARLNDYAYDMLPAQYLEELTAGDRPVFWRANPPRR